jgi:predicted NUDIX family NTP pyrophosphohydrolase
MKKKSSAGCILFRRRARTVQVLIAHMGGPYWAHRDEGSWSIPKGEYDESAEVAFEVALREFEEELGSPVAAERFIALGPARQPSGKTVTVWAAEGDFDAASAVSNTFSMEWPKGSGNVREFPEVDRAGWFDVAEARRKLLTGHHVFLDRLMEKLREGGLDVDEGESVRMQPPAENER